MSWWVQLLACFFASVAFSLLVNEPRSTVLVSSVIAVAGYAVFMLLGRGTIAYFAGTMVISLSCEVAARVMKRTATLFLTSALIPLVPGVGLYNTMRYVVIGNYTMAAQVGTDTVLGICGIALAITVTSVIFGNLHQKRAKKHSR